ncbi:hypothetical protein ASE14_10465 [Agromyces sp. Root81]|uniref:hypothetical protein n=1 Tax=Agromyces sp. Root81 TaxID=1736601 RepID=UPI0006FE7D25|nr:hypothetical protein [Agromyces sp. Root81]KRC61311.1 hypothetical protein ASE14_10465 [Agromyces sp. Root81]
MIELTDIDYDDDGELVAAAVLPGERHVAVLFAGDDEPVEQAEMRAIAERALSRPTADDLSRIDDEVVHELTDSAYEGTGHAVTADDYDLLARELELQGVIVTADATLVLIYEAPSQYPDMVVYCQLDEQLAIDDLSVAEADGDDDADGAETVEFDSVEALLDSISAEPPRDAD